MLSFPQLIVCAAMYKLTPQYVVSYDQVDNLSVHYMLCLVVTKNVEYFNFKLFA